MERADRYCKNAQNKMGDEIISADNINYFEVDPDMHFASCEGGGMELWGVCNRLFGNGTTYNDDNGFDRKSNQKIILKYFLKTTCDDICKRHIV